VGRSAHAVDSFDSTPRLALLSPEKGSGKTRTLEVLDLVVPEPMHAINLSAAAVGVGAERRPTLLLDEADVEPFRERLVRDEADELRNRLARWAAVAGLELVDAWPDMPPGIIDRAADVWEPLVAVADYAGGHWPERARSACMVLNAQRQQRDPSLGVQLLADCRRLYTGRSVDRMTTETLIDALVALDESPWGELRGKPIDARGLARRLRKYDVRPGDHRFDEGTRKGYLADDFHDAWSRYLPPVADVSHVAHPRALRGVAGMLPLTEDEVGYDLHNNNHNGNNAQRPSGPGDGQHGQQGQHPRSEPSLLDQAGVF
jgi:hypothetical protein